MGHSGLLDIFIYLVAAVISVPIAKRLGLGSVLGYLAAGVVIGPMGLKLVSAGSHEAELIAEFGVIMMLFLIGLELRPSVLWQLRGPIFGMGTAQVVGTTLAVGACAVAVGLPWKSALAIGLILAMSSTAIVLQSLNERGLSKTSGGEACFSVLLFQDLAVIPILSILPLLALTATSHAPETAAHGSAWIDTLAPGVRPFAVVGAVAIVFFAGRYLLRPILRFIAATRMREIFTAAALLIVVGVTLLMQSVQLSPALGAFLGGVVLADSEYRHQLEADIEPFKGLFLGLFFISVGAALDFSVLTASPGMIVALVAGLIAIKLIVLLAIGFVFRLETSQVFLFGLALAQGGEFAFVLFNYAAGHHVLGPEITKPLGTAVALSMAAAPLLLIINDRLVQPLFAKPKDAREPDKIDPSESLVVLAGFGRFGHVVGRLLNTNGFETTVLDSDAEQVELLRQYGLYSFYGDASRHDLLEAAGISRAKLLALAIDDEQRSIQIIEFVKKEYPNVEIFARATSRQHAYTLYNLGVKHVYRDTFSSAVDMGVGLLTALGMRGNQALRAAKLFKDIDEDSVRELAPHADNEKEHVWRARQHMKNLEDLLKADALRGGDLPVDRGWDPIKVDEAK